MLLLFWLRLIENLHYNIVLCKNILNLHYVYKVFIKKIDSDGLYAIVHILKYLEGKICHNDILIFRDFPKKNHFFFNYPFIYGFTETKFSENFFFRCFFIYLWFYKSRFFENLKTKEMSALQIFTIFLSKFVYVTRNIFALLPLKQNVG